MKPRRAVPPGSVLVVALFVGALVSCSSNPSAGGNAADTIPESSGGPDSERDAVDATPEPSVEVGGPPEGVSDVQQDPDLRWEAGAETAPDASAPDADADPFEVDGAGREVAEVPSEDVAPDAPPDTGDTTHEVPIDGDGGCTPLPGPDDCDGVDDDCDGVTDEDHAPGTTTCGVGACATTGALVCFNGVLVDTCVPAPSATEDATCDGVDGDCDGLIDEEVLPSTTSCGLGACAAVGSLSCVDGVEVDTCRPGQPAATDATCDGVDDDCDGHADEDAAAIAITCGDGACTASGVRACVDGVQVDACSPSAGAAEDASCDGVDDDCDGQTDEEVLPAATTCGLGACAARGGSDCVSGIVLDSCEPGTSAPADTTCDGVDDDCDGATDEDAAPAPITCGEGACTAQGVRSCQAGALTEACQPGEPAPADTTCDGVDDDCDGSADEDYLPTQAPCGAGACRATGTLECVGGALKSTCSSTGAAAGDANCNGLDDDCDGLTDEGFVPAPTTCGLGACKSTGVSTCEAGLAGNTCLPGTPANADDTCDAIDDDCDGLVDEDVGIVSSACGVGACATSGLVTCTAGSLADSCAPGKAAPRDEVCDGRDDDCDGLTDEDFVTTPTACGVGGCKAQGARTCMAGVAGDSCVPGTAAPSDSTCDGVDDDCDGLTDEGYAAASTACGVGACARSGQATCAAGLIADSCVPGPSASSDGVCNGQDDDCDGLTDEDFVPTATTCTDGTRTGTGALQCNGGVVADTCVVAPAAEAQDYAAALALTTAGAWTSALAAWSAFEVAYPASLRLADARFYAARCEFGLADFPSSLAHLQGLVTEGVIGPHLEEAMFLIGRCDYALLDYGGARATFESQLASFPAGAWSEGAHYYRGRSAYELGDFVGALVDLAPLADDAASTYRDSGLFYAARCDYELGVVDAMPTSPHFTAAEARLLTLLASFPGSIYDDNAHYYLGLCSYWRADYTLAITRLTAFRALFPTSPFADQALYFVGRSQYQLPDYVSAEATFTAFLTSYPASTYADNARYYLGRSRFEQANYVAALADFTALTLDPVGSFHGDALYYAGRCEYELALPDPVVPSPHLAAAEAWLQQLFVAHPGSTNEASGRYYLGMCAYEAADYPLAITRLDAFRVAFPASTWVDNASYYIALSWYKQNLDAQALVEFDALLAAFPASTYADNATYFSGRCHYSLGLAGANAPLEFQAAAARFQQVLTSFPTSVYADNASYYLIRSKVQLGDCVGANASLLDFQATYPASSLIPSAISYVTSHGC